MTEIGFYHLTRSKLQEALPKLLGRVLDLQAESQNEQQQDAATGCSPGFAVALRYLLRPSTDS